MEHNQPQQDYIWDGQEWGYTGSVKVIECDRCDPTDDVTREDCRLCGHIR